MFLTHLKQYKLGGESQDNVLSGMKLVNSEVEALFDVDLGIKSTSVIINVR